MDSGRRVMVAVALAAAVARVPGVYTHALWEDEVASARILAEPTFPGMLRHVTRTESTPPLWYALGWCVHLAGVPIRDVRLLSVLAGAVLAAVVVDLARRVVPLAFAAVAGLLVAFGGELVAHGSELRSYELLALLAALFARCLLDELEAPSRRRELALAAVVAAGGLTHFFFAFTVGAALLWLWLDPGARARRRAGLSILAGGAVASTWAPVMLTQYHANRFWWSVIRTGWFSCSRTCSTTRFVFQTKTVLSASRCALCLNLRGCLRPRAREWGRELSPKVLR